MSSTALVVAPQYNLPALPIEVDIDRAKGFAMQDKAESTRACYRSDFRIFEKFCRSRGVVALPATPETVAAFLASEAEAGRKPSTIGRRCAAIRYAHRLADFDPPTTSEVVKATMRGIRRTLGVAPRRMAPATSEKTIAMAALTRRGLGGKRDKAILLLGFALAARRSEISALDVGDITECPEGLHIRIKRSKTDQEGQGVTIPVCRGSVACPVAAVKEWLAVANITAGPVFMSVRKGGHVTGRRLRPQAICVIVKQCVAKLGLDPKQYGAHSLRSGFLTSAAARGKSIFRMMDISRHASMDTVRIYVREADAFRDHPGDGLL